MPFFEDVLDLDWSFRGPAVDPLANVHWYPARFVPQVPGVLLGQLAIAGSRVLDPFCGSGTTLVEARRRNMSGLGIDTNPVAVLIAQAKLSAVSTTGFARYVSRLEAAVAEMLLSDGALIERLPTEELRCWFHPETLRELSVIFEVISKVQSKYSIVSRAAFSAIQRSASSQQKHWGWTCDNVRPKDLQPRPALPRFFDKLLEFGRALSTLPAPCELDVVCGTALEVLRKCEDESFDVVVTSPPYYGTVDYIRSQRLTLYWMGLDLDDLKSEETGARFKRYRKHGRSEFLTELTDIFNECYRVLKPGATMALVIGESPAREGYVVELTLNLAEIGFVLEGELDRSVSLQRSMVPSMATERVMVWSKKG